MNWRRDARRRARRERSRSAERRSPGKDLSKLFPFPTEVAYRVKEEIKDMSVTEMITRTLIDETFSEEEKEFYSAISDKTETFMGYSLEQVKRELSDTYTFDEEKIERFFLWFVLDGLVNGWLLEELL